MNLQLGYAIDADPKYYIFMKGEKKIKKIPKNEKINQDEIEIEVFDATPGGETIFISRTNPAVINQALKLAEQYEISFELEAGRNFGNSLKIEENEAIEVREV